MNHKIYITLVLLVLSSSLFANEDNSNERPTLFNNSWTFRIGQQKIADTYLSPLEYKGLSYSLAATHGAYYRGANGKVSWEINDTWQYAMLINPAYTSAIQHLSLQLGYSTHRHWKLYKNLHIAVGGKIEGEGGVKYLARNVNNPASADINLKLYASTKLRYTIETKPVRLIFQYHLTTPIAGAMFIPEYGQPYYNIYIDMVNSLSKNIIFSSLHNNYGAQGTFNFDMAFKNFTLRTSFFHRHMYWNGNGLTFYQKELSGGIGIVINANVFYGKKNQPLNTTF